MIREQLLHEFPEFGALWAGRASIDDGSLWALSEALHRSLLEVPRTDAERTHHLVRIGESFQGRRNLAESTRWYTQALDREPPGEPTRAQREALIRHAPVLLTNALEPFPLVDVVAFHHPERRLLAYHLFWEDDYNFPEDHEPCDHEQLWVAYSPEGRVTDVCTFFHSQLLGTAEAVIEANNHGGRPQIRVEWGLHGSLVTGWQKVTFDDLSSPLSWLEGNFQGVKSGGRVPDHPLKRRWPKAFMGDWSDYIDFPRPVDSRKLLEKNELLLTTRWANPTLQQHCLRYNFAVKFDWPFDWLRA